MPKSVEEVVIGSDVLEIVSIAMYAEPLVLFRELLQNSADGIERAIRSNILGVGEGQVSIDFDRSSRSISILDNGYGLSNQDFTQQMLSFGASAKRNDTYRGFRGIGRLAALGHCRALSFRSRSLGDPDVYQVRWDCLKVRDMLLDDEIVSLEKVARDAVDIQKLSAKDQPKHFFEAKMEGVRRLADDRLFDSMRVTRYIAQVAPVPFHPKFSKAAYILAELERRTPLLQIAVKLNGSEIFKPYRDDVEVRTGRFSRLNGVEFVEVPSTDRALAAFGWIGHTDYLGALYGDEAARGLRVRSGNMQVGDEHILAKAFPEERFNLWSIGEFHVFDPRLRPNARRDAFEPSVHLDNLFNQLIPYGNTIAKRCREESRHRNAAKKLDRIGAELDGLRHVLQRSRSPLGLAIRQSVAKGLLESLKEIGDRDVRIADPSVKVRDGLVRRIKQFSKATATSSRLSQRDRGRLDVIKKVQETGDNDTLRRLIVAMIIKK